MVRVGNQRHPLRAVQAGIGKKGFCAGFHARTVRRCGGHEHHSMAGGQKGRQTWGGVRWEIRRQQGCEHPFKACRVWTLFASERETMTSVRSGKNWSS